MATAAVAAAGPGAAWRIARSHHWAAAPPGPQRPAPQRHQWRRQRRTAAAAVAGGVEALPTAAPGSDPAAGLPAAKKRLLAVISGTQRGAEASALKRGQVEEAQVGVEGWAPPELDFQLLEGRWRLAFTTAADVVPIVRPALPLPLPLQFGRVWQAFSSPEEGRVQNIIEARLAPPSLLQPLAAALSALLPGSPSGSSSGGGGSSEGGWWEDRSQEESATRFALVVEAGYEVRTPRSIALSFREAGLRGLELGDDLKTLLASPLLPRGWWNQRALLGLQQLSLRVPLTTRAPGTSSSQQRPIGINYQLTYLDEDMLIGRAQGSGGTFIFVREQQLGGALV